MQRRFSIKNIVALGALLVLAWLGYKMFPGSSKPPSLNFSTTQVRRGDIGLSLALSGVVKPLRTLKLTSSVGAKIKAVYVKDGQLVHRGQLILEFDEEELKSRLASARVRYLKAQTDIKTVENWRSSPSYVDTKANMELRQVELGVKEKEYTQNQQLYQAKAISKQDLERSKLELDRAKSELDKSKAQLVETEAKGGTQALQEAQAGLIVAEIALREARENLADKDLRAPEVGIIHFGQLEGQGAKGAQSAELSLSPKSSVSPGQLLFTIESHDQLAAEVYVNEYDIHKVHPDQMCMIKLRALPDVPLEGRVDSISTEFADKLAAFKVVCRILPAPGRQNTTEKTAPAPGKNTPNILPGPASAEQKDTNANIIVGMSTSVSIPLEARRDVLIVPVTALVKQNNTSGVFVMKNGNPVFTAVQVGMVSQNEAEITEGLEEDQEILEEVPGKLLEKPSPAGEE
jgi:multidrug efflux pump subunit AcrA (membrane-fusion protein)